MKASVARHEAEAALEYMGIELSGPTDKPLARFYKGAYLSVIEFGAGTVHPTIIDGVQDDIREGEIQWQQQ